MGAHAADAPRLMQEALCNGGTPRGILLGWRRASDGCHCEGYEFDAVAAAAAAASRHPSRRAVATAAPRRHGRLPLDRFDRLHCPPGRPSPVHPQVPSPQTGDFAPIFSCITWADFPVSNRVKAQFPSPSVPSGRPACRPRSCSGFHIPEARGGREAW
ncbi:Protein of unknown function [Gryllus bimaculatus]|nr:Protein of unknown function [Gryllus bimaculatus]